MFRVAEFVAINENESNFTSLYHNCVAITMGINLCKFVF